MKIGNFVVILILTLITLIFYWRGLFNFFAQDDFILINQFSQNSFLTNINNVFAKPQVTHWRPVHNLYFAAGGAIFGKNYFGYHLITFVVHILSGYLIFMTTKKIIKDWRMAFVSSILYLINPSHIVSLYWISGGATVLGFFLFISAFYSFLLNKKFLAITFFLVSLLASEAMIVGNLIFLAWVIFEKRLREQSKFLAFTLISTLLFLMMRFLIFTPEATFDAYRLDLSLRVVDSAKYYVEGIIGLPEAGNIYFKYFLLLLLVFALNRAFANKRFFVLCLSIIFFGLFPFILLPEHLSPHYMNISIWGFAMLLGFSLFRHSTFRSYFLIALICILYFLGLVQTAKDHWVILRAKLAKTYITSLENENLDTGSKIIFEDTPLSTSREAYIALGTGKAVNFWFRNKNYKTCFTFYENCSKE